MGASVHSSAVERFVADEYVPGSHASAAVAPSGQYDPGVHESQAVALRASWYVPPAQGAHSLCPAESVKLPAGHSMQLASLPECIGQFVSLQTLQLRLCE